HPADAKLGVRDGPVADAPRLRPERASIVVGLEGATIIAETKSRSKSELEPLGDADRAFDVHPQSRSADSAERAGVGAQVCQAESDVASKDEAMERHRAIDPAFGSVARI